MLGVPGVARADSTLTFSGTLTEGEPEHVLVDFEVPAGTKEIQIDHDDLSADDILDWGLWSPEGFRGWGGGNSEPLVVGEQASSRSYLTGPITAGTWHFDIGKAKLVGGSADYSITVTLRDAPTLAAQPERTAYVAPGPTLSDAADWYAGDFHVHSEESGDASATFQQITDLARERGLDFVELSDHNTTAQLDFYDSIQSGVDDLLFIPGVEFTTYHGHANGVGATSFVDFRIGLPGVDIHAAAKAYHDQGALFSINHPAFDLGDACIGCAFQYVDEMEPGELDGIEVATAGSAQIFYDQTSKIWEKLAANGHRLAALGGSDDHRAGMDDAEIGSPTTLVLADNLSEAAIIDAIQHGRTIVNLRGPDDPVLDFTAHGKGGTTAEIGDSVTGVARA
ncbi:MAG TPA: CehA/McbA family metallohydrolase, partial [Polyangiaceae bacterium]|nr:CehA/McbA family metallohydrolase [Polyangiaceae bacterium]